MVKTKLMKDTRAVENVGFKVKLEQNVEFCKGTDMGRPR